MSDSPYIVDVSAADFEAQVLARSAEVPVLVDFWASWCQPCQMLMPVLTGIAQAYQGRFVLAKVNSDEQQELATRYGVRSLPTVKVFRHGEVVDEFMGAQPESVIRQLIDKHMAHPSGELRAAAREAINTGDAEAAEHLLNEAEQLEPGRPEIQLERAQVALMSAQIDTAVALVQGLPPEQRESDAAKRILAAARFAGEVDSSLDAAAIEQRLETDANDSAARYQRAARAVVSGQYEPALDDLLYLLMHDRSFNDGAGRSGMLAVFELLGNDSDLVGRYRRQMFNALH